MHTSTSNFLSVALNRNIADKDPNIAKEALKSKQIEMKVTQVSLQAGFYCCQNFQKAALKTFQFNSYYYQDGPPEMEVA